MTADEIRSKYMNVGTAREPLEFEYDGDSFRLRVPSVAEWSEFFNSVYKQQTKGKEQSIYIDIAHKKYAALQLLIDDEGMPIFDAKTAQTIFDMPIGSALDKLANKAVDVVEKHTSEESAGNSGESSGTTP